LNGWWWRSRWWKLCDGIMETQRYSYIQSGNTTLHLLEDSTGKKLWNYRKADCAMHVTFEANIVLFCKLDTHNVQVGPNLLYLVVEIELLCLLYYNKYVDHAWAVLPGRSKWWLRLKWIPWSSRLGVGRGFYDPPRVKPYCFETSVVIAAQKMVRTSRDISFLIYQSFWYRELKEIEKLYWNGMAFVVLLI